MACQLAYAGLVAIIVGFALILAAALVLAAGGSKGKAAAVIFVGPVPIAVGNDRQLLLIAAVLALAMAVLIALFLRGGA